MKQHEILKKYLTGLTSGLSNNLMVVGKAGIGKTELVMTTLQELGLEEGQNYLYSPNFITPKALVSRLEQVNGLDHPKMLIMDDSEDTLRNLQSVGVLKGAMWSMPNGERRVSWITSRERHEFNFTGKIVFLLNYFNKKNSLMNAIKDRSLYFEINLSQEDIKKLILERAKKPYQQTSYEQRLKVAQYLAGQNNPDMSLRAYPHALNMLIISPNHWQTLVGELLNNKGR
jgi:hypothetical protein